MLRSHEINAIPHPMESALPSVGSTVSTKFGDPSATHVGAVAKSPSALLLTVDAHQRDSASPVERPHRLFCMEHSLSSASKSPEQRIDAPNAAQTSICAPTE